MASKKKVSVKPADRRALKTVLTLTERAQDELAALIKKDEAGTLGREKLETGLKKLQTRLARIAMHEHRL
jgi:hypothetical protein